MVLNSASDSCSTPRIAGPKCPVMIATCRWLIPARSAATIDANSQGSRNTRSGCQSLMILVTAGSAA